MTNWIIFIGLGSFLRFEHNRQPLFQKQNSERGFVLTILKKNVLLQNKKQLF